MLDVGVGQYMQVARGGKGKGEIKKKRREIMIRV